MSRSDKSRSSVGVISWWKHKRRWGKRVVAKRSRKLAKGVIRNETGRD